MYLSFTEYSQRYQHPKRGDWHIPKQFASILKPFYDKAYDYYEQTLDEFVDLLRSKHPEMSETQLRAKAGEDARYLLPLGVHTNLGMTANARALSEALEVLWASPYAEVRELAGKIVQAA